MCGEEHKHNKSDAANTFEVLSGHENKKKNITKDIDEEKDKRESDPIPKAEENEKAPEKDTEKAKSVVGKAETPLNGDGTQSESKSCDNKKPHRNLTKQQQNLQLL